MKKNLLFLAAILLCIKVNAQCTFPTSSFCAGTTISAGTWSSSDNAIATVDASTGAIHGVSSGSVTLTYTTSLGYVTFPFTVNDVPVVSALTGTTTVCVASSTALASSTTGGTWSSGSTSIATVDGLGNVWGVSAGNATISYGVTNTCGTTYQTAIVTVNPLPNAGVVSGAASVCAGSSTAYTTTATGGTWSSSNNAVATVDAGGNVGGASAGNATISYTVTNSCGTASSTRNITVLPLPDAGTISGSTSVCAGSDINLSSTVTGGTWSSSNTTAATVSAAGLVHGRTAGTTTITYSYTNSCGTAITTYAITVNPLPNAGTISSGGITGICRGIPVTLSSSGDAGGTWNNLNTANANWDATNNTITGIATASNDYSYHDVTVQYQVTNGCGTATATKTIRMKGIPYFHGTSNPRYNTASPIDGLPSGGTMVATYTNSTYCSTVWSGNVCTITGNCTTPSQPSSTLAATLEYRFLETANTCHDTITNNYMTYASGNRIASVYRVTTGSTVTLTYENESNMSGTYTWTASPSTSIGFVSGSSVVSSVAGSALHVVTVSPTSTGAIGDQAIITVSRVGVCNETDTQSITIVGIPRGTNTTSGSGTLAEDDMHHTSRLASANANIRISPNPNNGRFTVSTPEGTTYAVITITDINGRVLATRKTDKQDNEFDLGMRARGMYMVTVETNSKKYSQKIQID